MPFKNMPKDKKEDFRKKVQSASKNTARKSSKRGFTSIPSS